MFLFLMEILWNFHDSTSNWTDKLIIKLIWNIYNNYSTKPSCPKKPIFCIKFLADDHDYTDDGLITILH